MPRYGLLLLLCGALLVAAGCRRGGPPPTATPPTAPAWTLLPTERVYYDNTGGIRDSVRLVVSDEEMLRQVWRRATAGQADPPPLPQVDFRREMLLVVGAGRMTPEDQIQIDSVGVRQETSPQGRREEQLAVFVRTTEGCRRFAVDAFPVEMVRVRRVEAPVRFVERRESAQNC